MLKNKYIGIGLTIIIVSMVFLLYALKIGPFNSPAQKPVEPVHHRRDIERQRNDWLRQGWPY